MEKSFKSIEDLDKEILSMIVFGGRFKKFKALVALRKIYLVRPMNHQCVWPIISDKTFLVDRGTGKLVEHPNFMGFPY